MYAPPPWHLCIALKYEARLMTQGNSGYSRSYFSFERAGTLDHLHHGNGLPACTPYFSKRTIFGCDKVARAERARLSKEDLEMRFIHYAHASV